MAAFDDVCCVVVIPFFKYECALFLIKGGSFDQPFLQHLGIRGWVEGGSILHIYILYCKKSDFAVWE